MFRGKCSMLFHYDWISIPLVYTQVTRSASRRSVVRCTGLQGTWRPGTPDPALASPRTRGQESPDLATAAPRW